MAYISDLMGKPVSDVNGERIGPLQDVIASVHGSMPHPQIVAIEVKRSGKPLIISFADVAVLIAPAIPLKKGLKEIVPYEPGENDLYLVRDILDRQIIDTNGMRVVRVNDLELARVNGDVYVANVDIGGYGLLRRLGLSWVARRLASRFGQAALPGVISWDGVDLLPGDQPMRLKVPGDRITELHPADLAEIISDLSRNEGSRFLESLDIKTMADALEEVEPEFQASLVESMPDERVADVLEEMAPDEAADLLAELPHDRSVELLNLMEQEEAEDVRRLLTYPEDSAGGIMNTEYVALGPDLTTAQAIEALREQASEAETIQYIYVVDPGGRLLGVLSLSAVVLAKPGTRLSEMMEQRVISVGLLSNQDEVAQAIAKYNLLAIPVVDNEGRLQGIVTADDALDKIIPTAWKKRLPRLYH